MFDCHRDHKHTTMQRDERNRMYVTPKGNGAVIIEFIVNPQISGASKPRINKHEKKAYKWIIEPEQLTPKRVPIVRTEIKIAELLNPYSK